MTSSQDIRIDDYRYDLPPERIAVHPLERRDASKLLLYRNDKISETVFERLPELLPDGSLLIWNDTRVIPARLEFRKKTGAAIEIFLLEPQNPSSYYEVFAHTRSCAWKTIIGNQKKWKGEPLVLEANADGVPVNLTATAGSADSAGVNLSWTPESLPFSKILDIFGKTPIPPYLHRESTDRDRSDYQTVYAMLDGSVAAPTAGLHFTPELIECLKERKIRMLPVTLHVGSGTFVPVKSDTAGGHKMHSEKVLISKTLVEELARTPADKITAVGTTSLRSLESLYWLGQKIAKTPEVSAEYLSVGQWDPYLDDETFSTEIILEGILNYLNRNNIDFLTFDTSLMIAPGYRFRFVQRLITNFHQPSSTLLLLVSALVGDAWKDIYEYALAHEFRFLSYGDSSLLEQSGSHAGK